MTMLRKRINKTALLSFDQLPEKVQNEYLSLHESFRTEWFFKAFGTYWATSESCHAVDGFNIINNGLFALAFKINGDNIVNYYDATQKGI